MTAIKRFFLSRSTIFTLIALALGVITAGALVPQTFITSAVDLGKWRADHPYLAPLAIRLGLNHVYTTPLFAAILSLSVISLILSTIEQWRSAWQKTFAPGTECDAGQTFATPLPVDELERRLRQNGYLCMSRGKVLRLLRHPWGYWGNALLHLGMVVTIAASLCIALTQQRGVIQLAEGRSHLPGQPWAAVEKGILGGDLILPEAVRLDSVSFKFWATNSVKEVVSTVSFPESTVTKEHQNVAFNAILHYRGLRIYQSTKFGHAFYVEITPPTGQKKLYELLILHPQRPDKPSYNDFPELTGKDYLLRVKYFVDEEKKSINSDNQLLVLRLDEQKKELGQIPLKVGTGGSIGQFHFRLIKVGKWSQLDFVNLTGMPGIFIGFFIIILGGILNYFTPPREIVLQQMSEESRVSWRAVKFAGFYSDEFRILQKRLVTEEQDG